MQLLADDIDNAYAIHAFKAQVSLSYRNLGIQHFCLRVQMSGPTMHFALLLDCIDKAGVWLPSSSKEEPRSLYYY